MGSSEGVITSRAGGKFFVSFLKGIIVSLIISLVGILVFAVVLKFVDLSPMVIKIVNQVIKFLSILFGVKVFLKKDKSKGILKGAIIGLSYTIFSYLVFSLLVANFSFGLNLIFDVIFSIIAGAICGVIFVNGR